MYAQERTKDVYETIAGYPQPPLIPLPPCEDWESLQAMGLKLGGVSCGIVKAAMSLTGFRAFHRQLPRQLEAILRRSELRGAYLFAPVISATLALQDDPRNPDALTRAATLLFAARALYDDIVSARLEPDRLGDQVLEMGQYPNLFATSMIIEDKRARLFKSTNVTTITVAVAGRLYSLRVGNLGTETTMAQLLTALEQLAATARRQRRRNDEPAPGVLSAADHPTQIKAFSQLQQIRVNAESLAALRHSFLTLCLDLESAPGSLAEAALLAHSTNFVNRWHHASMQLVVFGNGKACVICHFSAYLDGNTMARAAAELQQRAAAWPLPQNTRQEAGSLAPATELQWRIAPEWLRRGSADLRTVLDNQQATFEIPGWGREFFLAHDVEAVPAFILALQMAARRLTGKIVRITQFVSLSRYRCMDLATPVVTTPEVIRFVEAMDSEAMAADRAMTLLHEAIHSQKEVCRKARHALPFDDLLALFLRSRKGVQKWYVLLVAALAVKILRLLGCYRPLPREVLVSHPEIYPTVPVFGRPGVRLPYVKYFGLHYQIMDEKIVITVMPAVGWTIPNAELVAEVRESLQRIQNLIVHAGRKS